MKNAEYRDENIGLLGHKPPYFLGKTSVLCGREVRCFHFSGRKTGRKQPKLRIKG